MDYITETGRIYAEDSDGKMIAEITFPENEGVATINHTYVDSSLRGRGIADELMRMAIAQIKADGHRMAATCPYAVKWIKTFLKDV